MDTLYAYRVRYMDDGLLQSVIVVGTSALQVMNHAAINNPYGLEITSIQQLDPIMGSDLGTVKRVPEGSQWTLITA